MKNSILQGQFFFPEDYFDFKSFCGDKNITQEEICLEMNANKFKHLVKTELKPSEQEIIKNEGSPIKTLRIPSEQVLMKDESPLGKALIARVDTNFLLSYEYLFRDEIAAKAKLEALYNSLYDEYQFDDIFAEQIDDITEKTLERETPEDSTVVIGGSEYHAPHGYSSYCIII